MKEIVSLFFGQAGVQLSNAVWELFAAEHCISVDGQIMDEDTFNNFRGVDRFFYVNSMNQALPRGLLIDLDATVIDEVRTGCYKDFFGPSNFISGFEDSASIFSRGYFTQGRIYLNDIFKKFNQQVEMADCLQGFVFMHALGGGTGSGLCSLVLEELDGYSKMTKVDLSIHPSFPSSPVIVEPYNSVLAEHYTIDETDISFLVDNEALFRMANSNLQMLKASYAAINRIVAQAFSSITSASRFGDLSSTISEVLNNLVPYPRIHFPTCSISPIYDYDNQLHSVNTAYSITKDALSNKSQLLNCFPGEGKYMTCCLMYRGNVHSGEIHNSIRKLKCHENLRFVDWCPTGIKVTLCSRCPTYIAKSGMGASDKILTIVSNNSAITDPMLHNTFRFQVLFQKRAFVHWYVGEGMEEDEFKDSLENIACLIKDYDECLLSTKLLEENPVLDQQIKDASVVDTPITVTNEVREEEVDEVEDNVVKVEDEINEDNVDDSANVDDGANDIDGTNDVDGINDVDGTNDVDGANDVNGADEVLNENNDDALNDNNYAEEDWVSSIQGSENYESYSNTRKGIPSNSSLYSDKIDHSDNFSISITIPVINKSF